VTLWVVKGGSRGEREDRMLANSVLGMGWEEVGDLAKFENRDGLKTAYRAIFPSDGDGRVNVVVGQLWAYAHTIKKGDTVVVPLKTRSGQVAVGSVSGQYKFTSEFGADMRHALPVTWYRTDVARSDFDQDLLYSFGAYMTVCTVHRDHAEGRVLATVHIKKVPVPGPGGADGIDQPSPEGAPLDLDQVGRDAILTYVRRRFKGHGLARLVDAVLRAQGLQTYVSPPGPDGGVDIVASGGALGLDAPRLVVQVKSGDSPAGTDVLLALKGVMSNYGAEQGLLVCWAGFKDTLLKEARTGYFRVRLWDQSDLLGAVFANYEALEEDLRAELPLKRVWTLAVEPDA
jgi:restriction system protein